MTFGYYSYRYPNLMNHMELIIESNVGITSLSLNSRGWFSVNV